MKRILSIIAIAMLTVGGAYAQFEVTKFLGIPVDGSKAQMIQKLKAKGFVYNAQTDFLKGQFNGYDVILGVETNNDKVYRIVVMDENYVSEIDIKIRFNRLCSQMEKNGKYMKAKIYGDYTIPQYEDISYEMVVNKKRYEAAYFQLPQDPDSTLIANEMQNFIDKTYGGYEELAKLSEDDKEQASIDAMMHLYEIYSKNSVWFMINDRYGKYGIIMYYDNENNQANGEDL